MNFDRVLLVVHNEARAEYLQRAMPAGVDVVRIGGITSGRGYKCILICPLHAMGSEAERKSAQLFLEEYLPTKLAPGKTKQDIIWL